jgi:hypothetical protein
MLPFNFQFWKAHNHERMHFQFFAIVFIKDFGPYKAGDTLQSIEVNFTNGSVTVPDPTIPGGCLYAETCEFLRPRKIFDLINRN